MFPSNVWSEEPVPAPLLPPHDHPISDKRKAQDTGPIAINDITSGLRARTWNAEVNVSGTSISMDDLGVVVNDTGITEVGITFDVQGRPFIAYIAGGQAKIWWFDPVAGMQTVTTLASGCEQIFCHLDERNLKLTSDADIVLIYIRAGQLQMLVQRDRFLVEYPRDLGATEISLTAFGMGTNNRMQLTYLGGA